MFLGLAHGRISPSWGNSRGSLRSDTKSGRGEENGRMCVIKVVSEFILPEGWVECEPEGPDWSPDIVLIFPYTSSFEKEFGLDYICKNLKN